MRDSGPRPLLLMLLFLAACAGGAEPAAFSRAAQDELARRPDWYSNGEARAFLVARDGQERAVLWGTWHVGYSGETVLPRAIRDRFAEAFDLTVEFPIDRMAPADGRALRRAFADAMQKPDPAALARLDPSTRAALDAADLPTGSLGRLSLAGLAGMITARALAEPRGPLPQLGFVDLNLMGFARSRGIPVHGLDTLEVVLASIASDPNGADAAGNLRQTLRQQPSMRDLMAWVRTAYGRGQVAEMLAGMIRWQADADDLDRAARQRAEGLSDRNAAWLPKLEAIFAQPGFHFAAFGAAHLLGEDGVVALLRRRGWQVLPCPGDNCPAPPAGRGPA